MHMIIITNVIIRFFIGACSVFVTCTQPDCYGAVAVRALAVNTNMQLITTLTLSIQTQADFCHDDGWIFSKISQNKRK